jgi:uncharacterized protein involved in exopolysaccharide biosynthesis
LAVEILKSRRFAEQVVVRYRLHTLWDLQEVREGIGRFRKEALKVSLERRSGLIRIRVTLPGTPRIQGWQDLLSGRQAQERDARVRELAAEVANEYIQLLQDFIRSAVVDEAHTYLRSAQRWTERARQELEKAQREWGALQLGTEGPPPLPDAARELLGMLTNLQQEKALAQVELDSLKAELKKAEEQVREQIGQSVGLQTYSPLLEQLKQQLAQLEVTIEERRRALGPEHPELLQLLNQREALQQEIHEEVKRLLSAGEERLLPNLATREARRVALEARLAALDRQIESATGELSAFAQLQTEVRRRELELRIAEGVYQALMLQLRQAEMEAEGRGLRIQVVDPAIPPRGKSAPRTLMNMILGLLMGWGLGAAWVWGFGLQGGTSRRPSS